MSHECNFRYAKAHYGNTDYFSDSSTKRYLRAHGDTTIFNFNYNYGGTGHCCGGHKPLGFWGGFGVGIGSALSRLLCNVGNWMSFGPSTMGWLNGNYGNWGNFAPNWSDFWNTNNGKKAGNDGKADGKDKCGKDCKCGDGKQDADYAELLNKQIKANELLKAAKSLDTADAAKVKEHNNAIAALVKELDDYAKKDDKLTTENDKQIAEIKKTLEQARVEAKVQDPADPTVGKVDLSKIKTLDDLNKIPFADIAKIDKDKAIDLLVKLGYLDNKDDKVADKAPRVSRVYKLLERAQVQVKFATNPDSVDQYVAGWVKNVEELANVQNGEFKFDIDCKDTQFPGYTPSFELLYTFQQGASVNGKKQFFLTEIDKNGTTNDVWIHPEWKTRAYIDNNNDEPLNISGEPQVSSSNRGNNRKKLADKASNLTF